MIFSNKDMFYLEIKILTPDKKNEVSQRMATDTMDSVITRLKSIIAYLEEGKKV